MKDCRNCAHCHRLPPRWWETCEIHEFIIKDCEQQAASCLSYEERKPLKERLQDGVSKRVNAAPSVPVEQVQKAPEVPGPASAPNGLSGVHIAVPKAEGKPHYHFQWLKTKEITAATIARLARVFFSQLDAGVYPEEELLEQFNLMEERIGEGQPYWLVFMYDNYSTKPGEPIAFALITDQEYPGVFYIDWVVVAQRNQGLGHVLLLELEQGQWNKFWTVTRKENHAAQRLLRKSGYREVGVWLKHWYGYDYIIYEKVRQ